MAKKFTPMMQQYMELKQQYKDCILFFRMGDFYEMFFEDAITASKELEITLTGRDCGQDEKAPMCGVPYHSVEGYLNKLISKGYKVAICEQIEDPRKAKGIVKRDVVRIVTPGTTLDTNSLDSTRNNYLMCIYKDDEGYGVSYVDITTGDFYTTIILEEAILLDEIAKVYPSEIIYNNELSKISDVIDFINKLSIYKNSCEEWYFDLNHCKKTIISHFNIASVQGLGIEDNKAVISSGALLEYLYQTQKNHLSHILEIHQYSTNDYMMIDSSTRRNLELVETLREKKRIGSLLWVLDKTKTAMGSRMLRNYIEQPLLKEDEINKRLDATEELVNQPMLREELKEALTPVYDLERLMTKISCQTANCKDLIAFKQSLEMLPSIYYIIKELNSDLFKEIYNQWDSLEDLFLLIDKSIIEEPPVSVKEGNIIKDGFNEDVDRLRSACTDGKKWIAELETKEREATGIKNLKIKYNKVFGYYIEVTKSYLNLVPERYTRKQTLANAERFITPELKEMENTILGAEEKVVALEYDIFVSIRDTIAKEVYRIKKTATNISIIDVIQSFSEVAEKQNYVRPIITKEKSIIIKDGRHPVVEKMMNNELFISNDTYLDSNEHRFSIITGPNMAGKSTYMRQVALIVLMAQIGSFVPASSATIGVVDKIFTRVGASDDLASGQSTFMVEMTEVANILRNATKNSLIILDEIGRGTSTFDGLSIAWAVVEYIVNNESIGAKTLFATHYHELTELEGKIEGVENYYVSVKENGDDIIFLRKILPGGADKSYGIQVAKLAGVPNPVIERAKDILNELTEADITKHRDKIKIDSSISNIKKYNKDESITTSENMQISIFDSINSKYEKIIDNIKAININQMTPIEALNTLHKLQEEINRGE